MPSHQSNPMMTVEQSLYLTTTWSPTTHQRSNSTPLFSTSKVSCSCLPIFQNLFNRTLSCMLHSVRWDEGEYFDDYCRIAFAFRLHHHPADLTACVLQHPPRHVAPHSVVSLLHSNHFLSFSSSFHFRLQLHVFLSIYRLTF